MADLPIYANVRLPGDPENDLDAATKAFVLANAGSGGGGGSTVTGGVITDVGEYRVHTFTSAANLTVSGSIAVEVLAVAGGGGGGAARSGSWGGAGGGGAGGFVLASLGLLGGTYPVTIGAGGNGAADYGSIGAVGGNSVIASVTAVGGGGGGSSGATPTPTGGGSGGGGGLGGTGGAGTTDRATRVVIRSMARPTAVQAVAVQVQPGSTAPRPGIKAAMAVQGPVILTLARQRRTPQVAAAVAATAVSQVQVAAHRLVMVVPMQMELPLPGTATEVAAVEARTDVQEVTAVLASSSCGT